MQLCQLKPFCTRNPYCLPAPGTYCVFTVNGYEGTGRSLSLKLIQQLREQASGAGAAAGGGSSGSKGLAAATASGGAVGRTFREVTLEEPIRCATYRQCLCNDPLLSTDVSCCIVTVVPRPGF